MGRRTQPGRLRYLPFHARQPPLEMCIRDRGLARPFVHTTVHPPRSLPTSPLGKEREGIGAVSYTHLDVYKRQEEDDPTEDEMNQRTRVILLLEEIRQTFKKKRKIYAKLDECCTLERRVDVYKRQRSRRA